MLFHRGSRYPFGVEKWSLSAPTMFRTPHRIPPFGTGATLCGGTFLTCGWTGYFLHRGNVGMWRLPEDVEILLDNMGNRVYWSPFAREANTLSGQKSLKIFRTSNKGLLFLLHGRTCSRIRLGFHSPGYRMQKLLVVALRPCCQRRFKFIECLEIV